MSTTLSWGQISVFFRCQDLRSLTAKYTISDQRANLKSKTIKLLECLKSWFRLKIFTEKDLYATVKIITEGGAEALEDLEEALNY